MWPSIILAEEGYLENMFGEAYSDYKREVPRFFPKLSRYKEAFVLSVKASTLYRTLTDGLVFFVPYPLLEFVGYLQGAHILPVLLRLYQAFRGSRDFVADINLAWKLGIAALP